MTSRKHCVIINYNGVCVISAWSPALSKMESLFALVNSPPTRTSLRACAFSSASPPTKEAKETDIMK